MYHLDAAFEVEADGEAMGTVFDGFLTDDGNAPIAVDGSWSQGATAGMAPYRTEADLTVTIGGLTRTVRGARDVA
jgi:hypothetical protein